MKNNRFKQYILPHVVAYLLFFVTVVSFFNPIFFQNKKLFQGDIPHHEGIARQLVEYRKETGKEALWNNRVFSGMPAYLLDVRYHEPLTNWVKTLVAGFMPSHVGYILTAMLAAYVLLLSFGIRPSIAMAGGLAYGLSTFTLISIGVGHDGKVDAMAWMPFVAAGVHIAYNRHRWWGAILTALGLTLEIAATHPQITYYLALMLIIYGISQFILAIRAKKFASFMHTSAALGLAVVLAISANFGRLWNIYEYGPYSIRGQSELPIPTESASSGLDKDYAFRWSLGKLETITLLIPNFYGGSSHDSLGTASHTAKALQRQGISNRQIKELLQGMPTYWGAQPFTEGPMYLGVITCFLVCLGLWIVPKTYRYWLLGCIALAILLSWGKNWPFFNNWMYNHLPGYNKFRAVTTAIVMAQLGSVLLACLALEELLKQGVTPAIRRSLVYTAIFLGGILVVSLDLLDFRDYRGSGDTSLPIWLAHALQADRKWMVQKDILRAGLFILAMGILLGGYYKNKLKASHLGVGMVVLMLVDYYGIGKRYIKDVSYKSQAAIDALDHTPAKALIQEDKSLGYRVFNLNNPFNDGRTSYYLQSVGGYHGAKLRRYQDLIEKHLMGEYAHIMSYIKGEIASLSSLPVLSMLNTRYLISASEKQDVIENPSALGSAWFVQAIHPVSSPIEEIQALTLVDLAHVAVIDTTKFAVPSSSGLDNGQLRLKVYQPNYLEYESEALSDGLAVFAEIYYPKGWQAYIDDQPVEHIRVNYVLRALCIPAGIHVISFVFAPYSYKIGNQIMLISSLLLGVLIILGMGYSLRSSKFCRLAWYQVMR
jgi:hypothetical protein